jgi:hypothetical protein
MKNGSRKKKHLENQKIYKVEQRSEHVEGYYYEPNKDYGPTEWVSDRWVNYWVILDNQGFILDKQFYTYQSAYAACRKLNKDE